MVWKYCNKANFWYNTSTFRGGAAVAQSPVKRLVVGSNPTRGALRNPFRTSVIIAGLWWISVNYYNFAELYFSLNFN
jgi:hypothetical protein